MSHIIHLSDIHIRPLDRHDEYQEVFNKLYTLILQRTKGEPTIIVICGDILHEKDRLKAETVSFTRKFFKDLLSITPYVIIFSGNHDLIEYNPERLDSLYSLSQDIPVIYLRNTCTYTINDLTFCHNSLIDKKFHDPIQLKTQFPNNILIGLYHGTLNQVKSYNKFTLESKVTKEQFAHYHLTLLGDIHKFQFVTPNIAYAGSLIQQDFGEPIKNHGFIHWQPSNDKFKWTGTHVSVPNEYGFVLARLVLNQLPLISVSAPNNVRIRINIPFNISKEQIDTDLANIRKNYNIIYEDIIYENNKYDLTIKTIDDNLIIDNFIKDHPEKENILSIHQKYKKLVPQKTEIVSKYFQINKLEFENMFIYHGSYNIIDFSQMGKIIAIPGPNAIGKSCILKILSFALFNVKPDTNINVIHKNANGCKIIVHLSTGNINYKVTRIIQKVSKKPVCLLERQQNNIWINESAQSVDQTIKKISELIGLSYDDFVMNYVFTNTSKSFLSLAPTQMITMLHEHFQLNIFKLMKEYVDKDIELIKTKINEIKNEIASTNNVLNEQQKKIPMLTPKTSKELKKDLKQIINDKNNINYAAITFKFSNTKDPPIENTDDFQTLYNEYVQISNNFQYNSQNYENTINSINEINHRLEFFYTSEVKSCPINTKTIEDSLNKWELFKQKLSEEKQILTDYINNFTSKETEIKAFINSILQGTYEYIPQNIKEITPEIYQKVLDYRKDIINLEQLNKNKDTMEIQFKNSEKANIIQRKLIWIQNKAIANKTKLEEQERILTELYHKRQDWEFHEEYIKNKQIDIKSKEKEINSLVKQLNILQIYSNLINKDKIPFQILKVHIENLNLLMNDFLKSFAKFTIDISSKITGTSEKLDIIIKKDNLNLSLSDLSGYETFILNMAFKYILSRFNLVNKVSLLFIDEGLDCIDNNNFRLLPTLFEKLTQFYEKVILISHIPEIKDLAHSIIKIERINNISSRII